MTSNPNLTWRPQAGGIFCRGDCGYFLALLASVILAWCAANALWDAKSWNLPTAYSAPVTSDVLTTLSGMKAVSDGHVLPMLWKTIPELGVPGGANWNDYPTTEEFPLYMQGLLGKAFGLFAGLNLSLLISHLLAAGVFYGVARFSGCDSKWSFVGALAFGLAPFIFAQSPHHITVASVWHVPLFIPVWRWISTGAGIAPWSRRFWISAAIAFLAGTQNVYYTNILCQLTLLGGLAVFFRTRSASALLSCLGIIAAAALAFGLMNLDTWTYRLVHGPNVGAVVREYKWLEIYGLKIVDLVVPPITHRSDLLAGFAFQHRTGAPLQDEGSYLGILGLLSLALLIFTTVAAFIRKCYSQIPIEAWQVSWILVVFTTGGLNAIAGALGFTMFRTGCRYSVVILAIVLMFAARWLSSLRLRSGFASLLAVLAATLVFWDQVPRPPDLKEREFVAFQIESDQEIVEKMEAALPPGAMVFQLPIMEFPEAPVAGLSPYDHLRPYLFSKSLRFSFGSMKGREDTQWQKDLTGLTLDAAVAKLRSLGFQAILINRNGFPDKAKGIIQSLSTMGNTRVIESAAGDLVCVLLSPA
jgi:phosphoglycerol transferase